MFKSSCCRIHISVTFRPLPLLMSLSSNSRGGMGGSTPHPTPHLHSRPSPKACAIYRWTAANSYFVISAKDHLALGSGGHFALWLDSELLHGSSGPSQTFANPCLSRRSNAASALGGEVGRVCACTRTCTCTCTCVCVCTCTCICMQVGEFVCDVLEVWGVDGGAAQSTCPGS